MRPPLPVRANGAGADLRLVSDRVCPAGKARPDSDAGPDFTCRYDLISVAEHVVIEVKYEATAGDVRQLRGYLDNASKEFGGSGAAISCSARAAAH